MTDIAQLKSVVESAFEKRDTIGVSTGGEVRDAVEAALELLDSGAARVAEPREGKWAVNEWLNKWLKRTEFMPFAPVVRAERADAVFDLPASLRYAADFMTTTCVVRPEWRARLPAIVHVDDTARPQVVRREQNPLYYDIVANYEALTGLPALINTSFNAHEEPIVNTPGEAVAALQAGRIDAIVTTSGLWSLPRG